MSGGAAHDGGKCALYQCTGTVTLHTCERKVLPQTFGTCTMLTTENDCTLNGGFSGGGSNLPEEEEDWNDRDTTDFPTGGTPGKIRCGTSWIEANSKCGQQCINNGDCTTNGEYCWADLVKCDNGQQVTPPAPTPVTPNCVSKVPHLSNAWCIEARCDPFFDDYCLNVDESPELVDPYVTLVNSEITAYCQLHPVYEGETWQDVAFKWDVTVEELQSENSDVPVGLPAGSVLAIPGDCTNAKQQAAAYMEENPRGSASATTPAFLVMSLFGVLQLSLFC